MPDPWRGVGGAPYGEGMADKAVVRREKFPEAYAIFDPIVAEWTARPDVALGAMFGSEGLNVRGKVFAFVTFAGELMVKLPESRVGELAEADEAQPAVMRGRPMREWATVGTDAAERWAPLVGEAYAHVDAITPRPDRRRSPGRPETRETHPG